MADINVDVNLPSAITVDVTSPTQSLATNVYVPGPQGPVGPQGPIGPQGPAGGEVNTGELDLRYMTLTGNQNISGTKNFYSRPTVNGTVVALSGEAGGGSVSIENLVYTTGDQIISGIKKFYSRPTVNNTGVLLSGEATKLPETIVYTTGNQTISGNKIFADNLEVQDTGIFNSLDLSNISEFSFSGVDVNLNNSNTNLLNVNNLLVSGVQLSLVNSSINLTSPTGVPSTITSPGIKGTIVWENEYIYICVNTNSWKRVQLSNW